jgi:hypothetical protein
MPIVDLAIIGAYFILMVGVGIGVTKKASQSPESDFLVRFAATSIILEFTGHDRLEPGRMHLNHNA